MPWIKKSNIDLTQTGQTTAPVNLFLNKDQSFTNLIKNEHSIPNYQIKLNEKKIQSIDRKTLVEHLKNQYQEANIDLTNADAKIVNQNIDRLLNSNTFTVTTGHQLCLFGGPLYVFYKVSTCIQLAKQLQNEMPNENIIPVFWLASEDHDWEEVNHFHSFNKKWKWHTNNNNRPVGSIICDDDLKILVEQWEDEALKFNLDSTWIECIRHAYLPGISYAQASIRLFHSWFKNHGLIVLDPQSFELKSMFKDQMKKDLFEQVSKNKLVAQEQEWAHAFGKTQVNVRDCNFFYIHPEAGRCRIDFINEKWELKNTSIQLSKEELLNEIENHPDRFSPNVILRPVYQELILPNLAYIGGPAELAYWLQIKPLFQEYHLNFPVVVLRQMNFLAAKSFWDKWIKLGLSYADLCKSEKEIESVLLANKNYENPFEWSSTFEEQFQKLIDIAKQCDDAFVRPIIQWKKEAVMKGNAFAKDIKKAQAQKNALNLEKYLKLRENIFPNETFQERYLSILHFANSGSVQEICNTFINDANVFKNELNLFSFDS